MANPRALVAGAGLLLITAAAPAAAAVPTAPRLASLPGAAGAVRAGLTRAAGPAAGREGGPSIDWALSGQASADSSESGNPAASAIDGDAGTDWCPNSWTGSLVVDLGRVRSLDGVGITLDAASPSASAVVEVASTAGNWTALPAAQLVALDPGNPVYVPVPPGTQARYARLTLKSGTGAPVCVGELRLFGPDPAAAQMALGGDLSFTPQELAAGARFSYRGQQASPVTIMRENGADYVRMRLWVNPPPGYSNLTSDLALARAVRAAGMKIYLDVMYSDFWADPQHQNIPAAWQGQDLSQLTDTVRTYTQQVVAAFANQGTPADLVSIGNEIRNGILWPVGQVDWTAGTGWDNLATLLKAGVAGAQAGNPPGHKLQIMMHFDQGGNNQQSQEFYSNLVSRGVPFDVIGLSYYPFFHGTISQLRANVDALAGQFHKPIIIAETQYPWTLANGDSTGNFIWQTSQVSAGYPASPGGQLSFVSDELSILAQVPGGLGDGLFYWAPEWIPGVGWEPGAGTPNDNLTLFNFQGTALPSIGIFGNPAAVCASYDPYDVPCAIG
ncbi:MAG TPA: glycosyl hydrolase 53 family protein [Streptosporangiaceae bacterium]|nr:glycosyl hydrolase 53 family protein [Streptosporangiaceae bacterium]